MNNNYNQIKKYLEVSKIEFEEKDEQNCKRFDIQNGAQKCVLKIYHTGTIQIQGAANTLKTKMEELKITLESGNTLSEELPFEIERFPELLKENIPSIDLVIVKFIEEAITTLKAGSNLGCAFLLGGASEKAILLLIDTYMNAIPDEERKNKFKSKISNKFISKSFEEFKSSWKSTLNKPVHFTWYHDIEIKIEAIFQFCRICRNEVGHPHLPPNLDRGILLANMGQFMKYIEDLYKLIDFYKENEVIF